MLEAILLDNSERLLGYSPRITGTPEVRLIYGDAVANSPASLLDGTLGIYTSHYVSEHLATRIALCNGDNSLATLKITPTLAGSAAVATDDASRNLQQFVEQPDGVIWAVGNTAGQYGLFKRSTGGAWSQVLADTAASYLLRWTNGDIYHKTSAGNWYKCESGAATITSDPGFYSILTSGLYFSHERDTVWARYSSTDGSRYSPNLTTKAPIDTANGVGIWDMAGTYVTDIPLDMWLHGQFHNEVSTSYLQRYIRLDATYGLFLFHAYAAAADRNVPTNVYTMAIINKTTGECHYIGSFRLGTVQAGTVGQAKLSPLTAWMASGVLHVLAAGVFVGSATNAGVLRVDIPINLNF